MEFHERYVMTHTPVVITDVVAQMTSTLWTLDSIRKVMPSSMHAYMPSLMSYDATD